MRADWVAVMLTYLLGDVLRIFAGDLEPGRLAKGFPATPVIIAAAFLIVFNLAGLPYRGAYDDFLIVVSLALKALVAWYAWNWVV
jgi:hypothetical protein